MARQKRPLAPRHLLEELFDRQTKLIQQHVKDLPRVKSNYNLPIH